MSSLHPCDEVSIRKGSSLTTLTAKKAESAWLDQKYQEYLAHGNKPNTAQGHNGKAIPFNPSKADAIDAEKARSRKKWRDFEITPESKKPKPKKPAVHSSTLRAMRSQQAILGYMRDHGACSANELTRKLGFARDTVDVHISKLVANGLIDHVATVANSRFYNIKGKGSQGKRLKTNNNNAKRGENTRAEIMQFLKSKGCPQRLSVIAAAMDTCNTNADKHIKILMENGLVRMVDRAAYIKLYEVVK